MNNMIVYLDMDGVLAEHDEYVCKLVGVNSWKDLTPAHYVTIYGDDDLFGKFKKTSVANILIKSVVEIFGGYSILTKVHQNTASVAAESKSAWMRRELLIQPDNIIFASDKSLFAQGNILIDDFGGNIANWKKAGGYGIKFKHSSRNYSVYNIIEELKRIKETLKITEYVKRYTLELPYPCSNNVYYRMGKWGMYLSANGRAFKDKVRLLFKDVLIPDDSQYALELILHPKITKKGEAYKKTLDIDNWFKGIFDSLTGLVYNDDSQIKELRRVRYGGPTLGGGCTIDVFTIKD